MIAKDRVGGERGHVDLQENKQCSKAGAESAAVHEEGPCSADSASDERAVAHQLGAQDSGKQVQARQRQHDAADGLQQHSQAS